MSSDNQSKYGANRNLWRKYYPVGAPRREPQSVQLFDVDANVSYSLDLQTTIRHRDFFKIIQHATGSTADAAPGVVLGEYDEGLIPFNFTTEEIFNFNFAFSNDPVIVFTVEPYFDPLAEPQPSLENINAFGIFKNTNVGMVGVSAPFSGNIRYRAAWASSYPANFTSSYSASVFVASAGSTPAVWITEFTSSFDPLTGAPVEFRSTTYGTNSFQSIPVITDQSSLNDVYLSPVTGSFTTSTAPGTISAPYSGTIDFIAVQ